jgi:beta-glucosidase
LYYNHFSTGRPGPSDLVFWTHYGDEKNEPLYPFGFGLSYTAFEYSDLAIDANDPKAIRASVTVKNTGSVSGEEVTQLYIRDRIGSVVRPVKELKGFQKYQLKPGEAKRVEFTLTNSELGFYTNSGEFIVEPGEFDIMIGTNSQTGLTGRFTLK